MKKQIKSFVYAFEGLFHAMRSEQNLRIHLLAAILVVILGLVYNISRSEWLFVVIAIGLVITAELFNTSIEVLTNIASPEISKHAKIIKDVAAAAVLISAVTALIIGLIIFIPRIFQ